MTTGNRLTRAIAAGFLLLAAACSDDEPGIIGLNSVVQNLTLDPDGRTTVLVTSANPSAVGTGNLQASGGQTALLVTQAGSTLTHSPPREQSPLFKQIVPEGSLPPTHSRSRLGSPQSQPGLE